MDKKDLKVIKGGRKTLLENAIDIQIATEKPLGWGKPQRTSVDILNDIQRACDIALRRPHFEHLAPVPKKENK